MPTYEYRCPKGHEFDLFQRMSDEPRAACRECGESAERLMSAGAGLIFKGDGFYITDYRSDAYKEAASSDKEAASSEKKTSGSDSAEKSKAEKSSSDRSGGSTDGSGKSTDGRGGLERLHHRSRQETAPVPSRFLAGRQVHHLQRRSRWPSAGEWTGHAHTGRRNGGCAREVERVSQARYR